MDQPMNQASLLLQWKEAMLEKPHDWGERERAPPPLSAANGDFVHPSVYRKYRKYLFQRLSARTREVPRCASETAMQWKARLVERPQIISANTQPVYRALHA